MGLLDLVNISFTSASSDGIKSAGDMSLGICLQDVKASVGTYTVKSARAVDSTLSALTEDNREAVKLALKGVGGRSATVHVYVTEKGEALHWDTTDEIFGTLDTCHDDWLVFPGVSADDAQAIATWIKESNAVADYRKRVVLPYVAANDMHVVHFAAEDIVSGGKTYDAATYAARVAGFFAALSPSRSSMYAVLDDVESCKAFSKKELDEKANKGELHLFNDGQYVRFASGVNSLTTLSNGQTSIYQHVKEVQVLDLIHNTIKYAVLNNYIGKYTNSYTNRLMLVSDIKSYLEALEQQGLLETGYSTCEIDVDSQIDYLRSIDYRTTDGRTVDNMTDEEILHGNMKNKVFIKCSVMVLGAIESVDISVGV